MTLGALRTPQGATMFKKRSCSNEASLEMGSFPPKNRDIEITSNHDPLRSFITQIICSQGGVNQNGLKERSADNSLDLLLHT